MFLGLDLRALRAELIGGLGTILEEELDTHFSSFISSSEQHMLYAKLFRTIGHAFDKSTNMDSVDQMDAVASSTIPTILEFFKQNPDAGAAGVSLSTLSDFQASIVTRATQLHYSLRKSFLTGARGSAPAASYLGLSKGVYEFIRKDLGVKMHGNENLTLFPHGINADNGSIGQNISKIYEVRKYTVLQLVFFLTVLQIGC